MSLREIDAALSKVQEEIDRCEQSLAQAKERQQQLQQDRVKAEQKAAREKLAAEQQRKIEQARIKSNVPKSPMPKSPKASPTKKSPKSPAAQAYVEKIAELKRQIAQAEAQKAAAQQVPAAKEEEEYEEVTEEYEEYTEVEEEEEIVEEEEEAPPAPTCPTAPPAPTSPVPDNPSARDYSDVRQQQLDALKQKDQWSTPNWGGANGGSSEMQTYENHVTPSHTHLNDQMRNLKQKHQWEKPAWASQSADNDVPVDTTPIANPLLKHHNQSPGSYTRQVVPKDRLARSEGTFVAPRKDAPPPRLCWIVVDLNQKKLGKLVMHLYGQGTDQVVDRFDELKGLGIECCGKNRPVVIEGLKGLQVKFHITSNQTTKGLESKPDIYGVVQEGKEVLGAVKAADEHAVVTIRQAHIYPVKKARAS